VGVVLLVARWRSSTSSALLGDIPARWEDANVSSVSTLAISRPPVRPRDEKQHVEALVKDKVTDVVEAVESRGDVALFVFQAIPQDADPRECLKQSVEAVHSCPVARRNSLGRRRKSADEHSGRGVANRGHLALNGRAQVGVKQTGRFVFITGHEVAITR
jgi:hypothetical protein